MTTEERIERLRAHPDTIELTFAGEERSWFLGRYSFQLAKKHGVAMQDIIGQVNPARAKSKDFDAVEEGFRRFALMLWAGFLPFDPNLEVEDVEMFLSVQDMNRLQEVIAAPFSEFAGEAAGTEAAGTEVAAGKAPEQASAKAAKKKS